MLNGLRLSRVCTALAGLGAFAFIIVITVYLEAHKSGAPHEIFAKYGCLIPVAAAGTTTRQETFLNLRRCGLN